MYSFITSSVISWVYLITVETIIVLILLFRKLKMEEAYLFKTTQPQVVKWDLKRSLYDSKRYFRYYTDPDKDSALLTMPKPLTVWITINCGQFWKRWEYQTTSPASWEICMQVRKQQLELDMEQQTGSK